jgi:hypothetical protein
MTPTQVPLWFQNSVTWDGHSPRPTFTFFMNSHGGVGKHWLQGLLGAPGDKGQSGFIMLRDPLTTDDLSKPAATHIEENTPRCGKVDLICTGLQKDGYRCGYFVLLWHTFHMVLDPEHLSQNFFEAKPLPDRFEHLVLTLLKIRKLQADFESAEDVALEVAPLYAR